MSYFFKIYKVKDKKHKENETNSNKKHDKELLLWLVKIFHADPIFAFHVSKCNSCKLLLYMSWPLRYHIKNSTLQQWVPGQQ